MAIETRPETARPETQTHSEPVAKPQSRRAAPTVARPRWFWKRAAILIGLIVLTGVGIYWVSGMKSAVDAGPQLTHLVKRGELIVSVTEQGTLESSENTEIKCNVRGQNTVTWVIEGGEVVKPGDTLVTLDTLALEESINERSKYALWSRSAAERSKADVARSRLAIKEYLEGRYRAELMSLERDLAIAQSNLRSAQDWFRHTNMLAERGFSNELEVDRRTNAVTQAKLGVDVIKTQIGVLKNFTRAEQLEQLKGDLNSAIARNKADVERALADAGRRDRSLEELEHCVIKADRSGLVIYPSAAAWKAAPDIAEGATVHKTQVLLLMPDLNKMQVKVGIHESIIDRVRAGLSARVTLADKNLDASVSSVATVTSPAGWWTGNVVKYDTVIKLPPADGLKPGMSAEVEVIIARHENVVKVPVAAVIETTSGDFCWVKTATGIKRRLLKLGDSDDVYIIATAGIEEGEEVVLNPLAYIDEAQREALRPHIDAEEKDAEEKEAEEQEAEEQEAEEDRTGGKKAEEESESGGKSDGKSQDKPKEPQPPTAEDLVALPLKPPADINPQNDGDAIKATTQK